MNKIISSEEEIEIDRRASADAKYGRNNYREEDGNRIAYLENELATLKDVLERNNYEF